MHFYQGWGFGLRYIRGHQWGCHPQAMLGADNFKLPMGHSSKGWSVEI